MKINLFLITLSACILTTTNFHQIAALRLTQPESPLFHNIDMSDIFHILNHESSSDTTDVQEQIVSFLKLQKEEAERRYNTTFTDIVTIFSSTTRERECCTLFYQLTIQAGFSKIFITPTSAAPEFIDMPTLILLIEKPDNDVRKIVCLSDHADRAYITAQLQSFLQAYINQHHVEYLFSHARKEFETTYNKEIFTDIIIITPPILSAWETVLLQFAAQLVGFQHVVLHTLPAGICETIAIQNPWCICLNEDKSISTFITIPMYTEENIRKQEIYQQLVLNKTQVDFLNDVAQYYKNQALSTTTTIDTADQKSLSIKE